MEHWIERVTGGLEGNQLTDRMFAGKLVVFEGLKGAGEVVRLARETVKSTFAPHDPLTVHEKLAAGDYKSRIGEMRRRFTEHDEARLAIEQLLVEAGCAPSTTFRDRLILRTVPPQRELHDDPRLVLPPHRDTWGSGLLCQINWWMTIHDLTQGRTMVVFPNHFSRAIENDSHRWDWRRVGKDPDYPRLPTADVTPDARDALYLVVPPGALVAFSGAHLHASVANKTGRPRFSIDTRTVDLDHLRQGIGAPDLDHGDVAPACAWFRRFGDGASLQDVAKNHDTT